MKISGIFDYTGAWDEIEKAWDFISKAKSIEYKVSIVITPLDDEYKEFKDDAEYTLTEAAKELKHSDSSILRHAIKKGIFKPEEYRLVGKTYLILESAIERYEKEVKGKRGFAVSPQPVRRKSGPHKIKDGGADEC